MNLKLIGCIAMGVFVAHLALFMMVFGVKSRSTASVAPEPPNFHMAEEIVIDPATNTKIVNREITVSTKLKTELYQGRTEPVAAK